MQMPIEWENPREGLIVLFEGLKSGVCVQFALPQIALIVLFEGLKFTSLV